MNTKEILQKLSSSRKEFLETINNLSEQQVLTPGVIGEWSVKDILGHLTMWEAELVTLLWQASRGRKPTTAHFSNINVDEINNQWFRSMKNRNLDLIMADFLGVRKQTERRVKAFSNAELINTNRFTWLDEKPLWQWIANDSFDHEKEHHDDILKWLNTTTDKSI